VRGGEGKKDLNFILPFKHNFFIKFCYIAKIIINC
jgi:hypothetical protein